MLLMIKYAHPVVKTLLGACFGTPLPAVSQWVECSILRITTMIAATRSSDARGEIPPRCGASSPCRPCVHVQGLDEIVVATIMREVLKALEYVHRQGGIHRDIKVRGQGRGAGGHPQRHQGEGRAGHN